MKTLWAFFICVLSLSAAAQVTYKCEDNFKVFEGRYLIKEYNDAYKLLSELRVKCPKVNENLYVYGEAILKYEIEVAQTPEERKAMVEDLAALYNEQFVNFPSSGADVKKTQLQLDNKLITTSEAYKAFTASFNKNRQAFMDFNSILAYFYMVLDDFKSGKGMTDEQYFEKYGEISTQVAFAKNKITEDKQTLLKKKETAMLTDVETQFVADAEYIIDALDNVAEVIQKQSRDYVSCEKLEAYYGKSYEDHKNDYNWIDAMVNALYDKKCFKSALLQKGAVALHTIKPTKDTAYRLGMIGLKTGNKEDALKYLEQSASMEANSERKSDIYYQIASSHKNTDKAVAKKYVQKTITLNPKNAQAYLMLAEMYATVPANDECGLNNFERKTLNYLAIDTAKKAEVAEPKYKAAVAAAVKRYEKNLPSKEEAKAMGKRRGDDITFGCWINEKVTLPKL
ncbi:lipopolysaccharide assembly protein LapB [Flavobacterium sp. NRK1]|uniref:tetratricopeptide repeat protein n=1 Tax=Flavobacterium sp. NRK1 TaxID=2954929 RepID=UPI0020934D76|nr:hypothetical protein [Flavobacterium sp. NRK1]MCO6148115.1 hypothetical protein [Flavobacterium sp. NRK1]